MVLITGTLKAEQFKGNRPNTVVKTNRKHHW